MSVEMKQNWKGRGSNRWIIVVIIKSVLKTAPGQV